VAPAPVPLPPDQRTVGQLVAETVRLYGRHFWPSLLLGLSLAAVNQASFNRYWLTQVGITCAAAPLLTASYVGASRLAGDVSLDRRTALIALSAGTLAFLPAPFLALGYALPAVAWLAFVGLVVPVAVIERRGFRESFRRAVQLARADYVHAAGSLATLLLTFVLVRLMLVLLLHGAGQSAARIAGFLGDLVISPVLFLGAALLYFDQAARVVGSAPRSRRRRNADISHALEPDRPGSADAEVEPRPAAGGQP
jgi:hypothetical protein